MPVTAIVPIALALAAKAPEIYSDLKEVIELIASGKAPTADQLQKLKDIIAKHELDIDNA